MEIRVKMTRKEVESAVEEKARGHLGPAVDELACDVRDLSGYGDIWVEFSEQKPSNEEQAA